MSSCVKEPGEFEAQLNIVSLLNPADVFEVVVHKTAPAFGSRENLEINDAEVYIINNETQQVSLLTYEGDGVYKSYGEKPLAGYDYEIQVKAPGFPEAAATTYVPDLRDVVIIDVPEQQNGSESLTFSFSTSMLSNSSSNEGLFAYELIYTGPDSSEIDIPETGTGNGGAEEVVNDDDNDLNQLLPIVGAISDGSTTTVSSTKPAVRPDGQLAQLQNVSLRIVAVSPQFYDYLIVQNNPEEVHYSSVYTNESDVYTNYVGGAYGIFGGFNEKTIKLIE